MAFRISLDRGLPTLGAILGAFFVIYLPLAWGPPKMQDLVPAEGRQLACDVEVDMPGRRSGYQTYGLIKLEGYPGRFWGDALKGNLSCPANSDNARVRVLYAPHDLAKLVLHPDAVRSYGLWIDGVQIASPSRSLEADWYTWVVIMPLLAAGICAFSARQLLRIRRGLKAQSDLYPDPALSAQGDLGEVLQRCQTDLHLIKQRAARDPSNVQCQHDEWVSENKIGDILALQGVLTGARHHYQTGLDVIQRLAAADPSNACWQRDVVVSYFKLGILDISSQPGLERVQLLSKALQLAENLQQAGHLEAQQQAWPAVIRQALKTAIASVDNVGAGSAPTM